ncbi:hypothetical protein PSAC2689_150135 [Paraburkholderia sacchari]
MIFLLAHSIFHTAALQFSEQSFKLFTVSEKQHKITGGHCPNPCNPTLAEAPCINAFWLRSTAAKRRAAHSTPRSNWRRQWVRRCNRST